MATTDRPLIDPTAMISSKVSTEAPGPSEHRAPFRGGEAGTRWKFTVDDYYRMAEAGILMEDDRVELIEGEIIVMSPIGSLHASVTRRLLSLLTAALSARAIVCAGNPVHLDDRTEPQPDLLVLHRREDYYKAAHPTPADVYVLIEVMDSSAAHDRGTKLRVYARAGMPEVWLVDLNEELIEAHRRPTGERYSERREYSRGQHLAPEAFPDTMFAVEDILG